MGRVMRRSRWGILALKGRSLYARESNQRNSQRSTKSKRDGLAGEADECGEVMLCSLSSKIFGPHSGHAFGKGLDFRTSKSSCQKGT